VGVAVPLEHLVDSFFNVLRSSDKGRTWTRQSTNTKDRIYGLFMSKKYGWAVGENGLILKYDK